MAVESEKRDGVRQESSSGRNSEEDIPEDCSLHHPLEQHEESSGSNQSTHIDEGENSAPASATDENSIESSTHNEMTDSSSDYEHEYNELRRWAIAECIRHSQLDGLLLILRRRLLPDLPKTAKTFLKTTTVVYDIREMENCEGKTGQFVYFGIAKKMRECVNEEVHIGDTISLQINVDGVPLFHSSNMQLWPILCKVVHEPDIYKPVPIAIYAGSTKPKSANDYLAEFIAEMNQLSADGININGRLFQVKIQSFICDTPARSFLKCVKGHTGFYSCERCEVRGCRTGRCSVFPDTDCPARTDFSFRRQSQPEHHNGVSPLLLLEPPIDPVNFFILDWMHLCCLGVMKKLLKDYWLFGNLHLRLGRRSRTELSRRMECLKHLVTCEFQRKPRAVVFIAKWKATELRFFLLYCGVVVLKNILNKRLYKHFLLFHVACRILCSEDLALKYNGYAKMYLKTFFLVLREYYGPDSQVMNAHNLIHMADDVKNIKCCLTKVTAFPFENALGQMKKYVHTANQPLAQICRRLHEQSSIETIKPILPQYVKVLKQLSDLRIDMRNQRSILKLKFKGQYVLSVTAPDNVILLKNGSIMAIDHMSYPDGSPEDVTIHGKRWKIRESLFTYPCDSKLLEEWVLENEPSASRITCPIRHIKRKMIILCLHSDNANRRSKTYGISLLH